MCVRYGKEGWCSDTTRLCGIHVYARLLAQVQIAMTCDGSTRAILYLLKGECESHVDTSYGSIFMTLPMGRAWLIRGCTTIAMLLPRSIS